MPNDSVHHETKNSSTFQDLFIYVLKGRVDKEDEGTLGNTFLGNWVEDKYSFLFFSGPAKEQVARLLRLRSTLALIGDYNFTYEQWQGGSPGPKKIGDFLIVPAWEAHEDEEAGIRIFLDPGVVFGSGLHPTTQDCLRALSYTRKQKAFERVLDLGTGTGVLAVAAALLGAKRVLAVDLNPLCVATANKNVRLNHLNEAIQVVEGPAEAFIHEQADLVIANIHYQLVETLLKKDGFRYSHRLILSGLMRTPSRKAKGELERRGFQILREWDHDMTWFTILAERTINPPSAPLLKSRL